MKLQWEGKQLEEKRKQAVRSLQAAFADMLDHKEWIQMTELLWQLMSEKLHDAQLDVLRGERFSTSQAMLAAANERVEKFSRHQRVLRALNFIFKCYEVDWGEFLRTVVELVEGKIDVKGLDRPTGRDQSRSSATAAGKGPDDSRSG